MDTDGFWDRRIKATASIHVEDVGMNHVDCSIPWLLHFHLVGSQFLGSLQAILFEACNELVKSADVLEVIHEEFLLVVRMDSLQEHAPKTGNDCMIHLVIPFAHTMDALGLFNLGIGRVTMKLDWSCCWLWWGCWRNRLSACTALNVEY
jgi:hypothetical protein